MEHEARRLWGRFRVFLPFGETDKGNAPLLELVVCTATDCGLQRRGRERHRAHWRAPSVLVLLVACGDERLRHETRAAAHDILEGAVDEETDVGVEM